MSGGSLNYLCYTETTELFNKIGDMESVEELLISNGYYDIARDVRRLIEYCLSAENRISVLQKQLNGVFHAVEWYKSSDIGVESLFDELERYRKDGAENAAD